jgi:hypothetical protein
MNMPELTPTFQLPVYKRETSSTQQLCEIVDIYLQCGPAPLLQHCGWTCTFFAALWTDLLLFGSTVDEPAPFGQHCGQTCTFPAALWMDLHLFGSTVDGLHLLCSTVDGPEPSLQYCEWTQKFPSAALLLYPDLQAVRGHVINPQIHLRFYKG